MRDNNILILAIFNYAMFKTQCYVNLEYRREHGFIGILPAVQSDVLYILKTLVSKLIYISFIDFEKSLHSDSLCKIVRLYGITQYFIDIIKSSC